MTFQIQNSFFPDLVNVFNALPGDSFASKVTTFGAMSKEQLKNLGFFMSTPGQNDVYTHIDSGHILRNQYNAMIRQGTEDADVVAAFNEYLQTQMRRNHPLVGGHPREAKPPLFNWWKQAMLINLDPMFHRKLLRFVPSNMTNHDTAYVDITQYYWTQKQDGSTEKYSKASRGFLRTGRRSNETTTQLSIQPRSDKRPLLFNPFNVETNDALDNVKFTTLLAGPWDENREETWTLLGWYRNYNVVSHPVESVSTAGEVVRYDQKNTDEKTHLAFTNMKVQLLCMALLFDRDGNLNHQAWYVVFPPRFRQSKPFVEILSDAEQKKMTRQFDLQRSDDKKDTCHHKSLDLMPFPFYKLYENGSFNIVSVGARYSARVKRTKLSNVGAILLANGNFQNSLRLDLKDFSNQTDADHMEAKLLIVQAYITLRSMYNSNNTNGPVGPGHMPKECMLTSWYRNPNEFHKRKVKASTEIEDHEERRCLGHLLEIVRYMNGSVEPRDKYIIDGMTFDFESTMTDARKMISNIVLVGIQTREDFVRELPDTQGGLLIDHLPATHTPGNKFEAMMHPENLTAARALARVDGDQYKFVDASKGKKTYRGMDLISRLVEIMDGIYAKAAEYTRIEHKWKPIFDGSHRIKHDEVILQQKQGQQHLDVFGLWTKKILNTEHLDANPEDRTLRDRQINQLASEVKQIEGDCMTVFEFLTSPYNCSYLPFVEFSNHLEDGEMMSPVCTRCVRPFYEARHTYVPFGVIKFGALQQYGSRPTVSKPRPILKDQRCGVPFDVDFEQTIDLLENNPNLSLTLVKQATGSSNRIVYKWFDQEVPLSNVQASSDYPQFLYLDKDMINKQNPNNPVFDPNKSRGRRVAMGRYTTNELQTLLRGIKTQAEKKSKLHQLIEDAQRNNRVSGTITINRGSSITQLKQFIVEHVSKENANAEDEDLTNTSNPINEATVYMRVVNMMHPSYQGNIHFERGTGYTYPIQQGFVMGSDYSIHRKVPIYNSNRFSYAFCEELYLERTDQRGNLCSDCFRDLGGAGRQRINMVKKPHRSGKMKLPKPTASRLPTDHSLREPNMERTRPSGNVPNFDNVDRNPNLETLSEEQLLEHIDAGLVSIDDMDVWVQLHMRERDEEMRQTTQAITGNGHLEMIVSAMTPSDQARVLAEQVQTAQAQMRTNFTNLKAFNDATKALVNATGDVTQVLAAFKAAFRQASSILDHNYNQIESQFEHLDNTAALAVKPDRKFDRHNTRVEEVTPSGREIHDMYLRSDMERCVLDLYKRPAAVNTLYNTNPTAPRKGVNFMFPDDKMFTVKFPNMLDTDELPANHTQQRSQKMTHIMVTYVLHRRAHSTNFNEYVIRQIKNATDELFSDNLPSLIRFGQTLRKVNGQWQVVGVGAAKKEYNMDNYPDSYPNDTFDSHMHYWKVTGGVEIAPVTKFFHFHMIIKMVHYSKIMFDYYRMADWLRREFTNPNGKYFIKDVDGTCFYKGQDRPYIDLRLYDQDDWENVAHEYVRKDAMKNGQDSTLLTSSDINKAMRSGLLV